MKLFTMIELSVLVLGITFLITEVVLPYILGKPLFPILRKKNREVVDNLVSSRESVDRYKIQKEAENNILSINPKQRSNK